MDAFKSREAGAEAWSIDKREAAASLRHKRIRTLGYWACKLMAVSSEEVPRYLDLLYRLGLSTDDDRIVIERVRDDVAAAGVFLPTARVSDMLRTAKATS